MDGQSTSSDQIITALQESEKRLARAQKIAHVGDWEWEIPTNAVHWSDELYRIYGFEPHEIAPDYGLVLAQMHPDSKEEFLQAIDAALNQDKHFEMDYAFFRKDGSEAILHTIGQVFRDESGAPVRMAGVVQDITEQKRAEMQLRISEEKFRTIFEGASDGILIADAADRQFIEANQTICRMLGYSKKELFGMGVPDIHPPADQPTVQKVFDRQMAGEIDIAENLPVLRKDGSVFYADINSTVIDMGGRPCMVGVFRDITERRLAEERLSEKNTMLQTLINAIPDRVFFKDHQGRYLLVNKATEETLQLRQEQIVGKTADELMPPENAEICKKSDAIASLKGEPFYEEESYTDATGETRFLDVVKAPIRDGEGNYQGLVVVGRDVTERKQAEERLRQSEMYIRSILDSVDEGFIVVDRSYRIHTANHAYCAQVGLPTDQVLGKPCYSLTHKRSRPCYEEGEECCVKRVFETGQPHTTYHRHEDSEGNAIFVETKGFPLKDVSGKVTRVIETVSDITEKKLLEEERLKVQKLEAIGTLAGGIAHDFNNLLQGVFGYLSLAKLNTDHNSKSFFALEEAEKALHLSVKLTQQLLTFSKGGKPLKKPVDLASLIETSARFSLCGASSGWRIITAENLWPVEADEGQISQVIQNVVLNAAQAMPESGLVEIETRNISSEMPEGLKTGKYVEIAIKDEGVGIPEKYLPSIFDPYFTTKEKGSGLGLATSFSIVKNHGGLIRVTSSPGDGSTFFIYLPASDRISKQNPPEVISPEATRTAKILVMDDEPMVGGVATAMLESLGHQVVLAATGEEAIAKYQAAMQGGSPFDLAILDLTIRGGLGGEETIKELKALDPGIKGVVSSGYADNEVLANYRDYGFSAFLNKPYTLDGLRKVLRELLMPSGEK